jgi:uncharacterized protein YceK
MEPRDDDIQFDFFEDEPATTESQPSRRLPRRGGRGTGMRRPPVGAPHGLTPMLRLLALLAIVVALLVIFGLLIQGCASTSKHDAAKHYIDKVAAIARSSQDDGTAVANDLITPGAKAADLASKLGQVAQQERQNVSDAEHLTPPGPYRDDHRHLIDTLQLRVSGVQGLAATFAANPTSKTPGEAAILSQQADRLLASDVIWDDLYKGPLTAQLQSEGISGVTVPDSKFVANRDLTTARSMSLLLTRLRGTSSGGTPTGLHGTNIVDVKTLPGGQTLSESTTNTVVATTGLAFVVAIHDGGNSQEVGIKVTVTIQKPQGAIVRTKTLQLINPGQTKTVTIGDLGQVPFAQKTTVNIDVAPVKGEHDTTNNKASFPVIFSLG